MNKRNHFLFFVLSFGNDWQAIDHCNMVYVSVLALVDFFLRLKSGSVRRKSEDWTYSDFPIKSCTPVSNSHDVYICIENLAI